MLVLAQVSSMNTRRAGSSRPWYFFHCARRLATSGRSCSVARMLFFEADAFVLEEVPDREVADFDAPLRQLGYQRPQGDIWLLGQAGQQPVTLRGQGVGSMSPHRTGRRIAGRPEPLRPLHDAGNAHTEGGRNLDRKSTRLNSSHMSISYAV